MTQLMTRSKIPTGSYTVFVRIKIHNMVQRRRPSSLCIEHCLFSKAQFGSNPF